MATEGQTNKELSVNYTFEGEQTLEVKINGTAVFTEIIEAANKAYVTLMIQEVPK